MCCCSGGWAVVSSGMVELPFCSIWALCGLAPDSEPAPLFSSSMILNRDPFFCKELFAEGSRFKIIEEENSGAGSDSGASTQNAKIEQKGRFTISDDTPAQQQEQQQPQQPQRKVTKKGRFIVEEEHNVAASSSQRSSGGIGASEIEQMCEKMVLFSRQQDDVIRSLREENESLRRRVAELGG